MLSIASLATRMKQTHSARSALTHADTAARRALRAARGCSANPIRDSRLFGVRAISIFRIF